MVSQNNSVIIVDNKDNLSYKLFSHTKQFEIFGLNRT